MNKFLFITMLCLQLILLKAQTNTLMYVGNGGKETFYEVMQITDGTILVSGYADNLDWVPQNVPKIQLTNTNNIHNGLGTNRYGFILHLTEDLTQIIEIVHFPKGAVEDIRFMKSTNEPYKPTGELYISGNTEDTYNNDGGYFLAKLDHNFINGTPTTLIWSRNVWCTSYLKDYHPWDVTNEGEIYYVSGEAFGYNWSAMYKLDNMGNRKMVENWRTHWKKAGGEWHGTPASAYPGGADSIDYSGIVLKMWGRCDLRSWTQNEYDAMSVDGNGGTKKGTWPTDILFNAPCDPTNVVTTGPGYNGYSPASGSPVHGGTCIAIDRRNNHLYIGMNMKSTFGGIPDFEPAVIAMDTAGTLLWWSRLYHEITPAGDTIESLPDQYVDALAIDYAHNKLVVGARCHGNNVENFWEGNTIVSNSAAYGFQNQFTGTNGNIHLSWIGKLQLANGTLTNSTYMGELAEGTGSLGTAHPDPNLDGWTNPNTGWPNVNTTKMAKNSLKVSSNGSVCVIAVGRRTITTANAYQKMVKPFYGGLSCWNSFARVYDDSLHVPLYSSLVVGKWDTLTQMGGDNTELFGIYKTDKGIICVGRQKADTAGVAIGNDIPTTNISTWATNTPQNQSAIIAYYQATNLVNENDSISTTATENALYSHKMVLYPNPSKGLIAVSFSDKTISPQKWNYIAYDYTGKRVQDGEMLNQQIDLHKLSSGIYFLQISGEKEGIYQQKIVISH